MENYDYPHLRASLERKLEAARKYPDTEHLIAKYERQLRILNDEIPIVNGMPERD